ncbi:MAG TPA: TerC/Alx family metal homeostasis membrane protein [Ginsengibacter sp.]|nr:TerC/Alx family metal homeostasis membrane protein [Ginsengibacter sp.]
MTPNGWAYLVFGVLLVVAIILDLSLMSRKGRAISIRQALYQTFFWVSLGILFGVFMWLVVGTVPALEYLSAYFMEWGLSLDNIFVFILIFAFFRIPEKYSNRLLLYGIMLAIVLRIIFITIGVVLVAKFHWILYIFGVILAGTGIRMMIADTESEFKADENFLYRVLRKVFPLTTETEEGKFVIVRNGRRLYTTFFVVFVVLAGTDILFALDSIPAVFAVTQNKMVIYTSNIFAVLGLRSLFFLLKGAVSRFDYLHEGIAIVLIFVGVKMLITYFDIDIHIGVSLGVIILCLAGSVVLSLIKNKRKTNDSSD